MGPAAWFFKKGSCEGHKKAGGASAGLLVPRRHGAPARYPPRLQVLFCTLTPEQRELYKAYLASKVGRGRA